MSRAFYRLPSQPRRWLSCAILVVSLSTCVPAAAAQSTRSSSRPVHVVVEKAVHTKPTSGPLDVGVEIAQVVAALAAFVGLFAVRSQLKATRDAARKQRTAEVQARWDDREFRKVISPVLAYLDVANARECVEKAQAWESAAHAEDECLPRDPGAPVGDPRPKASKNDVLYVLSYFEDLALLYNNGDLDRELVARSVGSIFVDWLRLSRWFLQYFRKAYGDTTFGREWEKMVAELRRERSPSRWRRTPSDRHEIYAAFREMSVSSAVHTFYVPAALGDASAEEWQRCASRSLQVNQPLEEVPEPMGWTEVYVDG